MDTSRWPREIVVTPFEAQLGDGYVAVAPDMPPRRRVSIEEFERDMHSVNSER